VFRTIDKSNISLIGACAVISAVLAIHAWIMKSLDDNRTAAQKEAKEVAALVTDSITKLSVSLQEIKTGQAVSQQMVQNIDSRIKSLEAAQTRLISVRDFSTWERLLRQENGLKTPDIFTIVNEK
jgi:hypothetical protein